MQWWETTPLFITKPLCRPSKSDRKNVRSLALTSKCPWSSQIPLLLSTVSPTARGEISTPPTGRQTMVTPAPSPLHLLSQGPSILNDSHLSFRGDPCFVDASSSAVAVFHADAVPELSNKRLGNEFVATTSVFSAGSARKTSTGSRTPNHEGFRQGCVRISTARMVGVVAILLVAAVKIVSASAGALSPVGTAAVRPSETIYRWALQGILMFLERARGNVFFLPPAVISPAKCINSAPAAFARGTSL